MLESLSSQQEVLLSQVRDEWIRIGLDCSTLNREQIRRTVDLVYKYGGMKSPRSLLLLDSPLAGFAACKIFQVGAQVWSQVRSQVRSQVEDQVWSQIWSQIWSQVGSQVRDQVRSQVEAQVGAQVWSQVWSQVRSQVKDQVWSQIWSQVEDQVRSQVGAQVGAQVWSQVWSQVRSQVGAQVRDQVRSQVGAQVGAQVGSQVRSQVEDQVWSQIWSQVEDQVEDRVRDQAPCWPNMYGQHETWWSLVDAMKRLGVKGLEKADGMMALAKSAGWCWLFPDIAIVTAKPKHIHLDGRGRLHDVKEMAIQYPDGYGFYAYHGVVVPERLILKPETITVKEILTETNVEVRRIMLDIYGASDFLKNVGAKTIHKDKYGELLRVEMPNDEPLLMVKLQNSTLELDGSRREYYLRVRPDVKTAHEAVASTFQLTAETYNPEVET